MIPILEDIIRGLLNGTMTPEQAKFYLEQHERLQAEVDAVSQVPFQRAQCLVDVIKKCEEQDLRWGRREYPSFDAQLQGCADTTPRDLAGYHEIPDPKRARHTTDSRGTELAWLDVLVEEVSKTTEHHDNRQALRNQLIDVAGVALQWAAQLTPEPEYTVEAVDNGNGTMSLNANVTLDGGATAGGGYAEVHQEADHEGPNLR